MDPLPTYRIVLPPIAVSALTVFCYLRNVYRFRAMLLGIVFFSLYGMVQDQFSARLCPQYFTVMHPPIVGLTDPTCVGIVWGFLGSWWGGALAGYLAGLIATMGTKAPPVPIRTLAGFFVLLIAFVSIVTTIAGLAVMRCSAMYEIHFDSWMADIIPVQYQRNLFVVSCYHDVAYCVAILGSIAMCIRIGMYRACRLQMN